MVSTVKVRVAGVGSVPAPVTARTWNSYAPSASPVKDRGEEQLSHAPVVPSRHSNVADGTLVKAKLASRTPITPEGPDVIVVSGAVVSTVKVRVAGVGSVPAPVTARTWNS